MSSVFGSTTMFSLVNPTLTSSASIAPSPTTTFTSSITSSPSSSSSPVPPNEFVSNLTFVCNEAEGFYLYTTENADQLSINNTCQARCSEWIIFSSKSATDLRDYSILSISMLGLLASFAVIFFSLIRYKRM